MDRTTGSVNDITLVFRIGTNRRDNTTGAFSRKKKKFVWETLNSRDDIRRPFDAILTANLNVFRVTRAGVVRRLQQ